MQLCCRPICALYVMALMTLKPAALGEDVDNVYRLANPTTWFLGEVDPTKSKGRASPSCHTICNWWKKNGTKKPRYMLAVRSNASEKYRSWQKGTSRRGVVLLQNEGSEYCVTAQKVFRACKLEDQTGTLIYILIWLLAFVAIAGNLSMVVHGTRVLQTRFGAMSNVEKAHNALIVNLGVADLIMGLYLLCLGALHLANRSGFHYVDPKCTAIAVLNFVSSQMSVTILAIITTCRLRSVLRPYSKMPVRPVFIAIALGWLFWCVTAMLPVIFAESFDVFVKKAPCYNVTGYQGNASSPIFEYARRNCIQQHGRITSLPVDLLPQVSVLTFSHWKPVRVGYYNNLPTCSMLFFFKNPEKGGFAMTMSVLCFNVSAFVYMLVAYLLMCRRATPGAEWCSRHALAKLRVCVGGAPAEGRREAENMRMHRRIFLIVLTDFLCWIPLSMAAIAIVASPKSVTQWKWKHFLDLLSKFAVVILSLNSAVNPLLYSSTLTRKWFGRRGSGNAATGEPPSRDVATSAL